MIVVLLIDYKLDDFFLLLIDYKHLLAGTANVGILMVFICLHKVIRLKWCGRIINTTLNRLHEHRVKR